MNLLNEIDWNWLAALGTVACLLGLILLVLVQFSTASFAGKTFKARGHKSAISERFQVKHGFWLMVAGLFLVVFSQTSLFIGSVTSVENSSWIGEWTVYQEEHGDFQYSAREWTLIIDQEGEDLSGKVYRKPNKVEGYLTNIKVNGNELIAKYGRNDGRKMEVEFLMYRDGKTFAGRYKKRHSRRGWKSWVSHKK
jgi:hypothetical protein